MMETMNAQAVEENTAEARAHAPAVSIIMPAYNVAPYISEALDSVLAQTFKDYETIVVNDGSPDTAELERVLEPYRENIRYLVQENRGAASARNTALRAARGRLVAFLDADDFWLPEYLTEQVRFLEETGLDLVYADAMQFGEGPLAGRSYMQDAPSEGDVTFESLIAEKCNVMTSGTVARRESIINVGLFDETLRRAHDYDLWLRLAKSGARLGYQKRILLHYRIHFDSLSGDAVTRVDRELRVMEKMSRRDDLTETERATLNERVKRLEADRKLALGKQRLTDGDFNAAAAEFREANKYLRSWKLRLVLMSLRFAPRLLKRVYLRKRVYAYS
jgi:glycosyltransferase involved in cell wall biosynthesis